MADDLAERVAVLEQENAELRARLAERDSVEAAPRVELVVRDEARRSRFAKLMVAGGAVALLGGLFAGSWLAVVCGLGWALGGAAVASTLPSTRRES